jgi:hypothetical protein
MNYPDEWLCERCCRPFYKHLKEGEKNDLGDMNTDNWCFNDEDVANTSKYKWAFQPMDNLTYVEKVAEKKGIVEENTLAKDPLDDCYYD